MFDQLRIEYTKSRPRHSNDNALAENKNGAIDAGFCSAVRVTLVGSMIPASIMSLYCLFAALKS